MKTNKQIKVISHISISKNKIISFAMGTTYFEVTPYFEVKDFSELTKSEKRRHRKHTQRLDAKMFWYNHGYLKAIQVYIKSIF